MSHQKPNARGFSHHLLLPLLAVLIVGSIGSYVMLRSSSAASATHYCSEKTFGRYKNNPVYAKYDNMKICVQRIQKKVGVSNQDGYYGDYTQKKVKAWQTKYNKTQTNPKKRLVVDGVVGGATWGAMKINQKYPNATSRSCKAKGSKYEWKSGKCQKKQDPAKQLSTSAPKTNYVTVYRQNYSASEYPTYPTLTSSPVTLDKNSSSYSAQKGDIDRHNLVEADQQQRAKVRYNLTKNFLVKGTNSQDFRNDCSKYGGKMKTKELAGDGKYFFPYQKTGKFNAMICGNK